MTNNPIEKRIRPPQNPVLARAHLSDWLNYIETLHPKSIDMSLERVQKVAKELSLTHFSAKVVLVGGTNGKGSTVSALGTFATVLNWRVGLYLSPHLWDFNERIQIQGQPVTDEALIAAFLRIEEARQDTPLTFFEFTTLSALWLFREADLDLIVLEVGLGGRLDAVNVVEPTLSIITTLGIDHTDYLGHTLASIAKEKSGICRAKVPVLIGRQAQIPELMDILKALSPQFILEGHDFGWQNEAKSEWAFGSLQYPMPEHGLPPASLSLALAAMHVLAPLSLQQRVKLSALLPHCVESSRLPGRFQWVLGIIPQIFDVAHNPLGAQWLAKRIKAWHPKGKFLIVWSSLKDKDLKGIVQPFVGMDCAWYIAKIQDKRAASVAELKAALSFEGAGDVFSSATLIEAHQKALQDAKKGDLIVVFGSFHTVAEILPKTQVYTIRD